MGLFDTFKKTHTEDSDKSEAIIAPKEKEKEVRKKAFTPAETVKDKKHTEKKEYRQKGEKGIGEHEKSSAAIAQTIQGDYAYRVLLRPVISEKSAYVHSLNQYVFRVAMQANKIMVKRAIKELYNVEPMSVRIITVRGKGVRRGRVEGRTSAYKKAIVRMPKGVELPVYEGV